MRISPEEANAWNYRVAFPFMGFRTLPPNPYSTVVGGAENITRPWSGVYQGPVSQGRNAIPSYTHPRTYELPEVSEDAIRALKRLLGMP